MNHVVNLYKIDLRKLWKITIINSKVRDETNLFNIDLHDFGVNLIIAGTHFCFVRRE